MRLSTSVLPDAVASTCARNLAPADGSHHARCPGVGKSPASQGLYTGRHEHDACGVAFVATMTGVASYDIVSKALIALRNLEHRGAAGSDPDSGDGAGILTQVPDAFLRAVVDFELPAAGGYAVGAGFLPQDGAERADAEQRHQRDRRGRGPGGARLARRPDHAVAAGCRARAPPCRSCARSSSPSDDSATAQQFYDRSDGLGLERAAFVLRKRAEREVGVYFPSLSSRTLVYKGMLTTGQLEPFYPDLSDRRYASAVALVHSRFSTNTFPSWPLAHPYRYVAHNGEINTVMGNRNWMRARESQLVSDLIPGDLERLFPICTPGASDSASFDEVLELLHLGGAALPHAVLMMIPEAWENNAGRWTRPAGPSTSSTPRSWSRGTARPASPSPTARCVGAVLDRNGLRPSRYWVTDDGLVVHGQRGRGARHRAGEGGPQGPAAAGPHVPRRHAEHRIVEDEEIKSALAAERPYDEWLHAGLIRLDAAARARAHRAHPLLGDAPSADLRLHRGGAAHPARPDGPHRRASRSGRWAPTPRSRCSPAARGCCSTTSPSCSRRSPTRRWTRSARSWSPRCPPPSAPR